MTPIVGPRITNPKISKRKIWSSEETGGRFETRFSRILSFLAIFAGKYGEFFPRKTNKRIGVVVKIGNIELGDFPLLLAPMEDVSDPPFRYVCKENGADLMYTEFISSEGLIRDAAKSVMKLDIFEYERPIGIQLFGGNIDSMREAAIIAEQAHPDLIDINYGCPVKAVACKGAGAALLQDIPKMVKMTEEVVKAVKLPVTVKTRLGWDDS